MTSRPPLASTAGLPGKRNHPLKGSPDEIEEASKRAPDSRELEAQQAVPPSPSSDELLGSPGDPRSSASTHSRGPRPGSGEFGGGDLREGDAMSADDALDAADDAAAVLDTADFRAQHVADLAAQVALVLGDIVAQNDKTPFSPDRLTRFHSRAPPGISIRDYILRIIKFCSLDKAVLLVLLYLAELFSGSYTNFVLNSLTVHRFLITACTVAAKGLCDQFCSNTHYAKVGGVSVMELNLLEVEFLTRVGYCIVPPQSALSRSYAQLQSKRHLVAQSSPSKNSSRTPSRGTSRGQSRGPSGPSAPGGPSSELSARKHARDEHVHPTSSASDGEPPETRSQPHPPGKASGNKGFKAMKETLRFLNPSKKKRDEPD